MSPLEDYVRKRRFDKTPEPRGTVAKGTRSRYVIFLDLRRDKSPRECRWDERER